MTEWALVAVIVVLLVERVIATRAATTDRRQLVRAVIARHGGELAYLESVDGAAKRRKRERIDEDDELPIGMA